ncbi:MAG: right-handed parallel beta-helix repeat-containing protein, partial [candidate division Zixibacteria bacterium]
MKSISTIFMASIVLGCSSVYATTIHIPVDFETIQEGIEASDNGDTVLVAEGIYQEHLDYLGKNIIVVSEAGPEVTVIEPQNSSQSIISFTTGEARNSIFSGFTVRNSENAPAVLIRSTSPSILDNVFFNNSHNSYGGALSADNNSFPLIKDNLFRNNSASRGGGIDSGINGNGDMLVEGNIFISNISSSHGGALFIRNASSASLIHRNIFYQNHCPELGGGMCVSTSSNVAIYNNTFSSNSNDQTNHGAGITIWYSSNCSVFNNIVINSDGDGIFQAHGSSNEAIYNNCWGNLVDYDGITPGPGSISADPLFIGGEPFDFRLQAGSPCIDAGDPDSPLDPDGSIADMGAYYFGSVLTATIDIADTYGENGQPVDIPLVATGLSDNEIAGTELHVAYDSECLEYTGFSSDYLTDPLVNVADGVINVLWEDYENPITLPDTSSVIDLQFTVLGQIGNVCAMEWTGNNELVDPQGDVIDGVSWDNGSVTIIEFHSVSGNVVYYDLLTPIPDVTIQLSGDHNLSMVTDDAGAYVFETLFPGSFTICPSRADEDPGVTVTDIVNIRRHIVRLETFDSPYKLIAADVNTSGGVSVADVIKIRRYLADLDNLPGGNW